MFKKFLFLVLFIFITLTAWKQDSNAETWERYNTTISADSILAAIERGDSIIIDSCEIFGPLIKIGMWEKPDTITNLIRITHTTFQDTVSFLRCYFLKDLSFDSTIFLERVSFSYTTFSESTVFSGVNFHKLAHFSYSTFTGYADFSGTIFSYGADFLSATFSDDASFNGATISVGIFFWKATFSKSAYFVGTDFSALTIFVDVTFSGDAFFRNASFKEANFREAQFAGKVDFSLKEFKEVSMSWEQLKGHLWFFKPAVYKLKKYFEEQRQLDDADGVYLFLKDQERIRKPWYKRYPEYWLLQQTCGYGVKWQNTLYLSIGIILVFMLFYTKSNAIREIQKEFGHRRRRRKSRIVHKGFGKRLYDALYFSVQTFIIGVVPDWYPTEEFLIKFWKIKRIKFRTLSMIEGALGWILLVLFVVTLTRKFIR